MVETTEEVGSRPEKLFTFRSGGWVLVAAGVVTLIVMLRFVFLLGESKEGQLGDGKNVASYGFADEPCLVDKDSIVASGFPRNGIRALTDPDFVTITEYRELAKRRSVPKLVSADRMIGVAAGGEAKMYAVRMLNWHEIVNDTLGEIPVAVTYHGLSDGAAVFDRRIDGRAKPFLVSGLLWNSTQLFFAKKDGALGGESLWSQMRGAAIRGPHASKGATLTVVPFELTTFAAWAEKHPDSLVMLGERTYKKKYKGEPFRAYYARRHFRFPVTPEPEGASEDLWSPMVVEEDGRPVRYALRWAWLATR